MRTLRNIYITGDVNRANDDGTPSQVYNIKWLYDLISAQLHCATEIVPKLLLPGPGFKTSYESWLQHFDLSFPSWHSEQHLTPEDLVIGFEMPRNSIHYFKLNKIPFVNVAIWPIRFLEDLVIGVEQDFYEYQNPIFKLQYPITEEYCYLQAQLVKAQLRANLTSPIPQNSALIVGQTAVDRSLILDGQLLTLKMFEDRLNQLVTTHGAVYFKPHPYYRSVELLSWLRKLGIETTDEHVYKLISYETVDSVISISSSVLHEAKYFGKKVEFFGNNNLFEGFVPIDGTEFLTINFWARFLAQTCFTLPQIKEFNVELIRKPNRLRKLSHNWWGYDVIDQR